MGQQDRDLKDAISLEAWLVDEVDRLGRELEDKRNMLGRVRDRKQELIEARTA